MTEKHVIYATKSGWLIASTLIRETKKAYIVKHKDDPDKEIRLSKDNKFAKLFANTDEAMDWMEVDFND